MADNKPKLTPALPSSRAFSGLQSETIPTHRVSDWGVSLNANEHSILLHLCDRDGSPSVPTVSYALSIAAAKQVSDGLSMAVANYLNGSSEMESSETE